ncbi:MAG: NCS2 family permease [Treponema sp.]|jgi:AGZA family xanthine/uracil permease-like MFS transporter|nr:NCS2 family permease [Treponema sp.]
MEKFFKVKERGSTMNREIVAGLTTFLAMSYILAVNPGMLSACGGMSFGAVFTATALSSAIATLVMALAANLPVALAPGMGLNAFFAFTVVLGMGVSFQTALTAVLFEGLLFIILSAVGVREAIINSIPAHLKKAVAVGIGLFIAMIGLADGGILAKSDGGMPIMGFVNFDNKIALVAALGLIITVVLYVMKVPGSILIGIIATTIIGIPFGVTSVPEGWGGPVSLPEAPLFFKFDFSSIFTGQFFLVFFTFLFVDMFDTIGTLMGVAEQANLVDKKGNIPNIKGALFADAVGTVAGACLGTSTVTSYVESTSGVAAGGRTGLSSVVTALLFLLALFLSPLFALIPGAATAPALIFVGFLMINSVSSIDFSDITEGIPAFVTIMVMPFSYSIANGISWGIIAYVICKVAGKKAKDIPAVTWVLAAVFLFKIIMDAVSA